MTDPIRAETLRALVERIEHSGAAMVFVGLGCPRQEVSAFELRQRLAMPLLAVGAAFNFHAGLLPQAPAGWSIALEDQADGWVAWRQTGG